MPRFSVFFVVRLVLTIFYVFSFFVSYPQLPFLLEVRYSPDLQGRTVVVHCRGIHPREASQEQRRDLLGAGFRQRETVPELVRIEDIDALVRAGGVSVVGWAVLCDVFISQEKAKR